MADSEQESPVLEPHYFILESSEYPDYIGPFATRKEAWDWYYANRNVDPHTVTATTVHTLRSPFVEE